MLNELGRRVLVALCVLSPWLVAFGQEPGTYTIPRFVFENGQVLNSMTVAYDTYGELNSARNNAVLVVHGASQGRNGYKVFIGPGKAFDTNKYFVIPVAP